MFDFQIETHKTKTISLNQEFDLTIIGGGPAGLNAALYAARKGLNVLIIAKEIGGQLHNTSFVDNYLGFENIKGSELSDKLLKHVYNQQVEFLTDEYVSVINQVGKDFIIITDRKKVVKTKAVLISTGGSPRKLGIKGEKDFAGRGVSYCTICDAPFFKDKDVLVVGGGNGAMDSVIDLVPWAKSITLVHRSQFRADQHLIDKVMSVPNLKIHLQTEIKEIDGDTKLTNVTLWHKDTNEEETLKVDGVFVSIGVIPNTSFLNQLVETNGFGEIIVDELGKTSRAGIYAAGDVTNQPYKQIIIAAADGAKAALEIHRYITHDYKENK